MQIHCIPSWFCLIWGLVTTILVRCRKSWKIALLLQEGTAARGPVNAAGELESGLAKACERCGEVHDLFYFPRRKTQLGGHWVHCFGCQHELRLIAKPPRQCVPLHQK